ncbi:hypothetical protein C3L33_10959, partial [Rhododendron williamsianum]
MTLLNHEEDPPNPPHKCTFLTSTIKEAFANCRNCHRRVPKTEEKEDSSSEMDDEQEVVVVSEIRSRAMEAKSRRKACLNTESLNFVLSPEVGELFGTQKPVQTNEESELERDEFLSVGILAWPGFSRLAAALHHSRGLPLRGVAVWSVPEGSVAPTSA